MQGAILVLTPAIIISLCISVIQLKTFDNYLFTRFIRGKVLIKLIVIAILAISSTFIIDYIYCNVLETQCKPVALAAIGFFFHALLVFITSVLFEFVFAIWLQKYFKANS